MSTRSTVYYDAEIHIFDDLAFPEEELLLEHVSAAFSICLPLGKRLSDIIRAGLHQETVVKASMRTGLDDGPGPGDVVPKPSKKVKR